MKRIIAIAAAAVGTVLLILATLVACVEGVAFDRDFYQKEYDKLGAAAYVGVERDTLDEATYTLLEYLQGKRDTLDMQARIGGETREYYNDKEKLHMVDVAALNQNAVGFMQVAYPIGGALLALAYLLCKDRRMLVRTCFFSIVGTLCAFGILAIWAAMDFNSFWISFHRVFFTNELWILDPAESLMIRMFQQAFFFDMVAKILAWFLGIVGAALVVTGVLGAKWKKG